MASLSDGDEGIHLRPMEQQRWLSGTFPTACHNQSAGTTRARCPSGPATIPNRLRSSFSSAGGGCWGRPGWRTTPPSPSS